MTQEEKAKAYDEAIEKAKKQYEETPNNVYKAMLEQIFPELKESEDERIRKELLEHCKNQAKPYIQTRNKCPQIQSWITWLEKQGSKTNPYSGISFEYNGHIWGMCARDNGVDILLDKQLFKHLEKQGEQKPADKVEPKFKIGDKILEKDFDECGCGTIIGIKDGKYIFDDGSFICIKEQGLWKLVEQKPARLLRCMAINGLMLNITT